MTRLLSAPLALPGILARHRFLLAQLVWRSFSARHAGSYLGWMWTPVATAVQFTLYLVVFAVILEIKVEGLGIDLARRPDVGFGVFLITGMLPFLVLNDAVLRSTRVFRANASLVQRVRFPAEVLVLSDTAGGLLHHAAALVVVAGVCLAGGHLGWEGLPWLGLGVALLLLWAAGLGLLMSVVGAYLPDVTEVLGLVLQVVFFAAPIVYPLAAVPAGPLRAVVESNPLTALVGVFRAGLLGASAPSQATIATLAALGLVAVALGAAALDRWRDTIPDAL
jgi:lipopolysaccharide transport system permease protein